MTSLYSLVCFETSHDVTRYQVAIARNKNKTVNVWARYGQLSRMRTVVAVQAAISNRFLSGFYDCQRLVLQTSNLIVPHHKQPRFRLLAAWAWHE